MFIAQGTYALDSAQVRGRRQRAPRWHLGRIPSRRSALSSPGIGGRRDNLFNWALLFELPDTATLPDGNYDLLVSAYLGSNAIKTATENNSSSKSEGVLLVTSAERPALTSRSRPTVRTINGTQFMPYGSFTAGTKPDRAVMTETNNGTTYSAGTIFASGDTNGYWYAGFGAIGGGTYTLDVLSATAGNSVTGLRVPG